MDRASDSPDTPDLTSPLPGRQSEQDALGRLLEQVLRGDGAVVLISGDAGIGKTTLSDRLANQARRQSALVLTGNCYGTTTGQPFAPWIKIHRELCAALTGSRDAPVALSPETVDSAGSPDELYERISGDFRAAASGQPLVVIIEDIHWADTASLELLRYFARQISAHAIMLVATCRNDEPRPDSALSECVPEIVRESRAHRFELRRLGLPDVQEFIETSDVHGAVDPETLGKYLHTRSEGNPFFMTELFRELTRDGAPADIQALPVPSLVRQVIENRVHRLTEETRSLLAIASVIGQDVPVNLWRSVSQVDDSTLAGVIEEAESNHLLQESGDGRNVRFTHGLMQETLYQQQVALRRWSIHRQIAEYLASQPQATAGAVAHHFANANDSRAIEWLVRAGQDALDLYAGQDAVQSINRVQELADQSGIPMPLEAYRIRARALEMLGATESARSDLSRLLQLSREAGNPADECQALIDLAMLWAAQDYQQCGDYLKEALQIARQVGDDRLYAQCLNRLANWQANTGEFDPAIEMHQDALDLFERIDDRDGIADTLDLLGTTDYLAGNYLRSRDYLERSVAISRDQGNKWRLASSLALLCNIGGDMDSTFDAVPVASRSAEYWIAAGQESIQTAREIGWMSGEAFGLAMLGAVHCFRGNLGQSLQCAESAEAIAHRIGHQQWLTAASLVLGVSWSELLDASRAEYYLERTLGHARAMGSHIWILTTAAALANLRLERGDDSGMDLLEPFRETELTGKAHAKRAFQFAWANQLRFAGELDHALWVTDRLFSYNEPQAGLEGTPQVLKLRAEILRDLGRLDEAVSVLTDAENITDSLGLKAMRWRVAISRAEVESLRGDTPAAQTHLQRARESAVEIARDVRDPTIRKRFIDGVEERIAGVSLSTGRAKNVAGLSPREMEVLRLVANGETDARVAEQLFISPRTVARHLQSIYTKLNVNSRTAATRFALEHDLISQE